MPSWGIRKSRGNTKPPQINLNFCPFLAYFVPFCPAQSAPIVQSLPDRFRRSQCIGVLPMLSANRERKPTRKEGTREGETKERQRQAHKPTKRGTPPHRQGAGSRSPHQKFAPKNQQKVALGSFEKIFGKIFRGNVSGAKKNPLRCLNGRGVAITNREISNLGNASNQKRTKALLDNRGQR